MEIEPQILLSRDGRLNHKAKVVSQGEPMWPYPYFEVVSFISCSWSDSHDGLASEMQTHLPLCLDERRLRECPDREKGGDKERVHGTERKRLTDREENDRQKGKKEREIK